ncbi:hypothetical protein [Acinetobacter pittii]|uniref:hypothetical protein n=1 Tax=Acinetobacter pittii TaxID=48296 RepID=UPI001F06DC9F|nr:hypothetical protein [Acinetobacter pittii]MCH2054663.1 hypothetical protein [Acinetobacter pittii]
MKKNLLYIFFIIILFFICLSISIFLHKYLNIEGDYLSAFATLLAAGVAMKLYTDWREQLQIDLFVSSKENLNKLFNELLITHDEMLRFLYDVRDADEEDNWPTYHVIYKKFLITFEDIYAELDNNIHILKKFMKSKRLKDDFTPIIVDANHCLQSILDRFNELIGIKPPSRYYAKFYKLLEKDGFEIETSIGEYKVKVRKNNEMVLNILLNEK